METRRDAGRLAGADVLAQRPRQGERLLEAVFGFRAAAADHQHELALALVGIRPDRAAKLGQRSSQHGFEALGEFTADGGRALLAECGLQVLEAAIDPVAGLEEHQRARLPGERLQPLGQSFRVFPQRERMRLGILPAVGLMLFLGNMYYAWMGWKLARTTGRADVCALPSGPSVPHMFIVVFVIMLPILGQTGDPVKAWEAGLAWVFLQGFILIGGAFSYVSLLGLVPFLTGGRAAWAEENRR